MLGRTADGIVWMFRYLERAENTARLLDAGFRMALTRNAAKASGEWRSVLTTLGLQAGYQQTGGDYVGAKVCDYVLRGRDNPESVLRMFERARTNARGVRQAITREVWEAINEGWMALRDLLAQPVDDGNMSMVLGTIRREATLVRGATYGTMLRDEIYHFARVGTYVERADNTARILDVKYYLLLPSLAHVGSSLDTAQWDNVLRSLAAERAYRWLNQGSMDPRGIAEFLVKDGRFPRSLAFSYAMLRDNLAALARIHGGEMTSNALIRDADMQLSERSIADIFDGGLHEFLVGFISANQALAGAIAGDYRFNV